MAEYRLSYTASEIDEKLGKVDSIESSVETKMNIDNPTGTGSLSLNRKANTTIGDNSVAVGSECTASGKYSFAIGNNTVASGNYAYAEGYDSHATKSCAHAEGWNTKANGYYSHSEGYITTAGGDYSHAEGEYTKAMSDHQHVQGKYNIEDTANKYAHIVGNGTLNVPSNAHTLDWDGNAWFAGDVTCANTLTSFDEVAATTETGNFVDAKALAETINKMKNMMCKTYELQCSVAVTSNYTINDVTAFLIGNNLSMYFSIERNANTTIGNVANEVIADVIITHNGKISGIRGSSFGAGASGGVTSFYIGEPNVDDDTVDFKIALGATTVAEKKWTTYVTFPVRLNMDAY